MMSIKFLMKCGLTALALTAASGARAEDFLQLARDNPTDCTMARLDAAIADCNTAGDTIKCQQWTCNFMRACQRLGLWDTTTGSPGQATAVAEAFAKLCGAPVSATPSDQ